MLGGYKMFFGKMSDVRVYNRALSATEISKIYLDTENKVLPKLNNYRNNLVGHWKLDENDSGSHMIALIKEIMGC